MRIYKYDISNGKANIPERAKILNAGYQGNTLVVWAEVDIHAKVRTRFFEVLPTGVDRDMAYTTFINTVFDHGLVFHVYLRH